MKNIMKETKTKIHAILRIHTPILGVYATSDGDTYVSSNLSW